MSSTGQDRPEATRHRLAQHLNEFPEIRQKIVQQMLITLHSRKYVSMDAIHTQAREKTGFGPAANPDLADPNISSARLWRQEERRRIEELTLEYSAQFFTPAEVDDLVNLVRKREEAHTLEHIAGLADLPVDLLADKVREFCALPSGETLLSPEETMGTRVSLIRHLISTQLEFIRVAKRYLAIRDFQPILDRTVGPASGMGKVGGKAAGMLLGYLILTSKEGRRPGQTNEPDFYGPFHVPIKTPETWYLRTDLFEEFLDNNGLGGYRNQKYKSVEEIQNEWPLIRQVFTNASFPRYAVESLRSIIREVGDTPLLVRSSSLLEDNFGWAFSGKYKSIFVGNQGPPEDRLKHLVSAVLEVYASALHPDPLLYRRKHDLLDYDEMMGAMIQKVVGRGFGECFLPAWAGVAFSHNDYRWNKSVRREDGLVRLVMGLGTRAVDRVGADYPRMVALTSPTIRPESSAEDIRKYSQRYVDVVSLGKNQFDTIPLSKLLEDETGFPDLDQMISTYRDDHMEVPATAMVSGPVQQWVITFDKLLRSSPFPQAFKEMLGTLQEAYGCPVDVEFAFDGQALYILQCRPQARRLELEKVTIPQDVPPARLVFSASRHVPTADVAGIEYIVYVDPRVYDAIDTYQEKTQVARVVGKLNNRLAEHSFVLMGPGRWGSNDINLGVRVTYADINQARVLIEIARHKDGYTPEVSYGTHFFQDLVEDAIAYVPLFPDEPGAIFNEAILSGAANQLAALLPDCAEYEKWVRVVDVPACTGGGRLHIVTDADTDRGLGFIEGGNL